MPQLSLLLVSDMELHISAISIIMHQYHYIIKLSILNIFDLVENG